VFLALVSFREEAFWTQLVDNYGSVPEVLIRSACNRGNSRLRQGKFEEALADYNRAIEISPYEVDPFLNRGIAYEALGRLEEALTDYDRVLRLNPSDPAGWNNRGNALLGLRRFREASDSFKERAGHLGPAEVPQRGPQPEPRGVRAWQRRGGPAGPPVAAATLPGRLPRRSRRLRTDPVGAG